jgi:hypothetical protein
VRRHAARQEGQTTKSGMMPASPRRNRKRRQRADIHAATASLRALSLTMRGEQRRRGRTVEHVRAVRDARQPSRRGPCVSAWRQSRHAHRPSRRPRRRHERRRRRTRGAARVGTEREAETRVGLGWRRARTLRVMCTEEVEDVTSADETHLRRGGRRQTAKEHRMLAGGRAGNAGVAGSLARRKRAVP